MSGADIAVWVTTLVVAHLLGLALLCYALHQIGAFAPALRKLRGGEEAQEKPSEKELNSKLREEAASAALDTAYDIKTSAPVRFYENMQHRGGLAVLVGVMTVFRFV